MTFKRLIDDESKIAKKDIKVEEVEGGAMAISWSFAKVSFDEETKQYVPEEGKIGSERTDYLEGLKKRGDYLEFHYSLYKKFEEYLIKGQLDDAYNPNTKTIKVLATEYAKIFINY
jgi:hypothetical protein